MISSLLTYWPEFLTIAVVHFLGVASSGPDFAVTVRQSVTFGKRAGLLTALGIGLGILVHVAYCVVGLGVIISKSILAFNLVKYLGAAYLVFIGVKALKSKKGTSLGNLNSSSQQLSKVSYDFIAVGFLTNALNPKATLFFLSVFSVVVSPATPWFILLLYGLWITVATAIWFSAIALLFSSEVVRNLVNNFGHWFDRFMGAVLIGLGLRLALDGVRRQ